MPLILIDIDIAINILMYWWILTLYCWLLLIHIRHYYAADYADITLFYFMARYYVTPLPLRQLITLFSFNRYYAIITPLSYFSMFHYSFIDISFIISAAADDIFCWLRWGWQFLSCRFHYITAVSIIGFRLPPADYRWLIAAAMMPRLRYFSSCLRSRRRRSHAACCLRHIYGQLHFIDYI